MTAVNEDAIALLGGTSNVLGTGVGVFVTIALLFFPTAFL